MKILVIQLARLGDIYQSWPTLRALRRCVPSSEIHLLCRTRFKGATEGLEAVDQVIEFNTPHLLEPLFGDQTDTESAFQRFDIFITNLQNERYDLIINLSFSGVSAWLTRLLAPDHSKKVRGFTRFADGALAIHDPESLYFFAQVGVTRRSRIHLTDVFAGVAGVDLVADDFLPPRLPPPSKVSERVVVHLGSSDASKAPDAEAWIRVLRALLAGNTYYFDLVGSGHDQAVARQISAVLANTRVRDFTGTAKIFDVFPILNGAKALIGSDSVAMHMASLTKTRCFNLSFSNVRFWETGPLSPGSVIYHVESPNHLIGESVAQAFHGFLHGQLELCTAVVTSGRERYRLLHADADIWSWQLIKALYFAEPWPELDTATRRASVQRLQEIAELALEELERSILQIKPKVYQAFWARIDELLQAVATICTDLQPLLNWLDGERSQIGPEELTEVLLKTKNVYLVLLDVIMHLQQSSPLQEDGHGNDRVVASTGL